MIDDLLRDFQANKIHIAIVVMGMLYGRAEDVVLHIEKEGRGNYGIRQKDMKKLDGLLIEEVHPIE